MPDKKMGEPSWKGRENEIEVFIRQEKDVSECFVGCMYLKE